MKTILLSILLLVIHAAVFSQAGSELTFENPVLISGTNLQQGAVYRFSNVKQGVDATIRLKKFSRSDIYMATVDNSVFGWAKAFQPEFGLQGTVAPNQNWFIDFEVTFYTAGTFIRQKLDTVDFTALDVDGDNVTLSEYVTYDKPNSIEFATSTALTTSPAGLIGSIAECAEDGIASAIMNCTVCGGSGVVNDTEDPACDGTGKLHSQCLHPYQGGTGTGVNGPITNFTNIDTSATLVMSVYRYLNRDRINFRYGARTSTLSTSAGVRLNSMWFRRFRLNLNSVLPLQFTSLRAVKTNNNVELNWTTESEININRYAVEKSTDGKNFKETGFVFAMNNGNNNYRFNDPVSGNDSPVLYYRIRTEELNGEISYSETRLIKTKQSDQKDIKISTFPNPVTNELRVSIPEKWQNKQISYEMIGVNGQVMYRKINSSSSQTEIVPVANLQPGAYIIRVQNGSEILIKKVIKQ